MHFNFYLLRGLRILLFPFSLLVGLYIFIRNRLYDAGLLRSEKFNLPMICIGNLSAGGTGKSPMTELVLNLLLPHYRVATLSRGYKRKTKGYLLANHTTTALDIGDEPMQFYKRFPQAAIAVGESRVLAIPQLLHDRPETQVIVLDDAFQHRAIKAGFNIVLSDYANMYYDDWFLPTGDLRDEKASAKRAQVIVVTKCPEDLPIEEGENMMKRLAPTLQQRVFFSTLQYGMPYHIVSQQTRSLHGLQQVLLVCGIANPEPLKRYLEQATGFYQLLSFSDHHIFNVDDMKLMKQRLQQMEEPDAIILTTEKDAVRLAKFGDELNELPIYVLPVAHRFLFDEEQQFEEMLISYVKQYQAV